MPKPPALVVALAVVAVLAGASSLWAAGGFSTAGTLVPSPQERQNLSLTIDADRMEYLEQEDRTVADGHAVLQYGTMHLTADHLVYVQHTGQLQADGHVVLEQGAQRMVMDRLDYNLFDQTGVMSQVDMLIPMYKEREHLQLDESPYRLIAKRLERRADGSFRAEGAAFTTCDTVCERGAPPWQFDAHRLRAVLDGYLVASGVTLRIKGTPVVYLPWFVYPLQNRQTGLLIPSFGFNSSQGFHYVQPFYWAIGRSQDATVSLDLRTSLGIGVNTEYRYRLTETAKGVLDLNYFHDWTTGDNFLAYHAEHRQHWWDDRLQLQWDVNLVNRKNYFTELSFSALERSQLGLQSVGSLTYRLDHQFFYLTAQYTQALVSTSQLNVQRLPEIGYRLVDARLGPLPLYANMQATVVNFYENSNNSLFGDTGGKEELRVDLFPSLTGRFEPLTGLIVTPTAGVRETYYRSRSLIPDDRVIRQVVNASLRAETQLIRTYGAITHLVEPALLYEYVHQLNTVDVPQFDEVDLVPEKRHVTLMLTNRLRRAGALPAVQPATASTNSSEKDVVSHAGLGDLLWIKLTESYALNNRGYLNSSGRPFTDLRILAESRPWSIVSMRMESFVNFYEQGLTVMNSQLRATPADWLVLTAGEHYTHYGEVPQRGDLYSAETSMVTDQIGGSQRIKDVNWGGQVNLPGQVSLATKAQYDIEHSQVSELTAAIRWRGACNECWSVMVGYQQLVGRHQVLFLITLRGLSSPDSGVFKGLFQD